MAVDLRRVRDGRDGPQRLPEGDITLLFSDIEGSTQLLHRIGDQYGEVLAEHDRVLRDTWEDFGGAVVGTEGDAFFVAFDDATTAVAAAAAAQRVLAGNRWPHGGTVRVRMGVHTGSPHLRANAYWGIDVHYAARLCSAANGGQVLLSSTTRALVPHASADDLGEHALKDFPAPRRLFHLRIDDHGAGDFPPPRTVGRVHSNLPSPPNRLIGRQREIEEVSSALTGDVRLLTLTGVGGIGKTRLAIACGNALRAHFPDGVFFVSLASVTDEAAVPGTLAYGVAVSLQDGGDPEGALVEHFSERRALVVVDNMEHLIGAAPLLSRLLEKLPGVRLLVTSQAPLRLGGEVVMPLGSLEVPQDLTADAQALEAVPAVALFLERARAADPSLTFEPRQTVAVGELCTRLDGLPLALELAAARVRLLGPERLLAALERSIDALGTGARDLPERQRGLRGALDYTVSLLEEAPRRLFASCAAFADAWTMEQADRMFGDEIDVWEAATELLSFSLIRVRGDGRLTMAEPIRSYAQELLLLQGRDHDCRRRHALMLAEEAEVVHDEVSFEMRLLAGAIELGREFSAAVAWSSDHDPQLHRRLVAALGVPYALHSPGTGSKNAPERSLPFRLSSIADDIRHFVGPDDAGDATSARLKLAYAMVLVADEDMQGAVAAVGDAAVCYRALGDERGEGLAVAIQAQLLNQSLVKDGRAAESLRRALESPAAQHDPRLRAFLLGELGINHYVMGRLDEAEALLSQVVDDPRIADSYIHSAAVSWWGDCALDRGEFAVALGRFAASLRLSGSTRFNALIQCAEIAVALAGLGYDAQAIEVMAAAQAIVERDDLGRLDDSMWGDRLRLLDAARDRLGESAVAKAQEQGRARDAQDVIDWALALADEHAA